MGNLIQFPRQRPGKKWSPAEILAIKDPCDTSQAQRERSGIAATKAIAAEAPKREKKKADRKRQIIKLLDAGEEQTIASLISRIGDRISRQTVADCLTELEAEGLVYRIGRLWISTRSLEE
ncbi:MULTISPECIES: hypothetical protein [unclassified Microcoleus]|uniref:hypothetical protein n=1 Tax=unclassified Microcoleus TaxID=2642155 RepID=UPI002FD19980